VLQLPEGEVDPHGVGPLADQPPGALGRAAPHLEDVAAADVTEQADVRLIEALRAPDEPDVPQERAVLGLVLVGGVVPRPACRVAGVVVVKVPAPDPCGRWGGRRPD
jgi:hypothetical protein